MKLDVQGVNLNSCRNIYKTEGYMLMDTHLCAGGEEGHDSCSGDSGKLKICLNKLSFHLIV